MQILYRNQRLPVKHRIRLVFSDLAGWIGIRGLSRLVQALALAVTRERKAESLTPAKTAGFGMTVVREYLLENWELLGPSELLGLANRLQINPELLTLFIKMAAL